MSGIHDAVVIGAGHNGLTTAALLAKHGRRVIVLERASWTGGLAAGEEFHPGYRSTGLFADTRGVRPRVLKALSLHRRGVEARARRPDLLALGRAGSGLLLPGEPAQALPDGETWPAAEAQRFRDWREFVSRLRPALRAFVDDAPVDLVRLDATDVWKLAGRLLPLRRLGARMMLELLRVPPLSVADWLDEWFDCGPLKAALALPALSGCFAGPRSPGTAANLLLGEAAATSGIRGGAAALASGLERAARDFGVEIRTASPVVRVLVDGGAVSGVETAAGERIASSVVAAACDPRQLFLSLVDPGALPARLVRHVAHLRCRGVVAHALFALEGRLSFACRPDQRIEFASSGEDLDAIERAFDAVKYRRASADPVLIVHVPTVADPALAPAGCDVVSCLVHYVPYDLDSGWNADERTRLLERVVAHLEGHAPGFSSRIARASLRLPGDLEERFGCSGGQIHHGEHGLDQLLVRPAPGCVGYRTPVRGLFLCGSGSHPGGGLTCAPGALAACAIARRRLF